MKKVISIFLSALMLLSILSVFSINAYAADKKGLAGKNATYTFNSSTGVLTISGKGKIFDFDWAKDDEAWDESPFYNNKKIKKIVIKNGITGINGFAFCNCTGLKSISIPKSVKNIYASAFEGCTSITSIKVSKKNKVYDSRNDCNAIINTRTKRLVKGCNTTVIPDTVKSIEYYAFQNCTKLKKIHIPKSVKYIDENAFENTPALEKITVAKGNENYYSKKGSNAIITKDRRIVVGCKNTVIPDNVRGIYDSAFINCKGLKSIKLGSKFKDDIGSYTFRGCYNLESIKVSKDNPIYDSRNNCNAVIKTASNTLVVACKNTVIPNTVETIGNYAFSSQNTCRDITKIKIPDSVTYINWCAFYSCKKLKSVTFSKNLDIIDCGAFDGCTALESINLPEKLRIIARGAFHNCRKLKSITFPDSLKHIGVSSFAACSNLKSIYIGKNIQSVKMSAFSYCPKLEKIEVSPENTTYDSRDNCNAIVRTNINAIMLGCKNTVIPSSVTTIFNSAFRGCKELESIEIPENITTIKVGAFADCVSLTDIKLPSGLEVIDSHMFEGCTSLKKIYIPKSVNSIREYAFSDCPKLKVIEVSDENETFDSRDNCNAVIDTQTNTLVAGCTGTTIPESVKTIGKSAFTNCKGLKDITIPYGVETIKRYSFSSCTDLRSVTFKKSLKKIEPQVFTNCVKLKSIYYSGTRTNWGKIDIDYKYIEDELGTYYTNGMLKKAVVFYNSSPLKVKSTKPVTKGFKVKWSKLGGAKGYQIQYSTSSSFKNAKRLTVKGNKTFTKTVKKLKKNKKYYVRVRGYKIKKTIKTFGAWSQYKTVKTK
ncbi:MAG: leucine-rich repeat domain-containing protein [Eubacterium sp.]|nr:leucine-rich repeat domain-containing protein [Eubacterium sp.]